jgi:hypothetical protein
MRWVSTIGVAALAGFCGLLPLLPATAQAPVYPSSPPVGAAPAPSPETEAAAIAQCLCLHRDLGELSADMAAKRRAYDELQTELSQADAQLARERDAIDVDSPNAVAQFSQQLQQRDALFRRSTGPAAGDLAAAVARYNAAVNQYNTQCANRPRDAALLSQVQATLSCPAP